MPVRTPKSIFAPARRKGRHFRGGVVLETVIVMPLLLMVTFGAAEYSYFFYVKSALAGAARDGVRAGIASTGTEAAVTTAVSNALTAAGIASGSCTVTTSPTDVSTAATGASVTVTVTATWGTVGVSPLSVSMGGISSTKQVTASVVMMKE